MDQIKVVSDVFDAILSRLGDGSHLLVDVEISTPPKEHSPTEDIVYRIHITKAKK